MHKLQHTNDNRPRPKPCAVLDLDFDTPAQILTDFEIDCLLHGLELERKRITNHWEQV